MLTEQQKARRKQGIGGSEAAAVLGLNRFLTAHDVWLEKTGRKELRDLSEQPLVYWGNLLEEVIAQEYAKRTHCRVRMVPNTQVHPQHSWMLAHLDRKVVGQPKLLECKTAHPNTKKQWGPVGSNWVPAPYLIQVQHYLAVTSYAAADIAVLIGGHDFRIYTIERDEELITALIKQLGEFWHKHVLTDIPPP